MNKLQANICLVCVTMIWSAEVLILSYIPNSVIPFAVSSMTNLIGAALLIMCFFRRIKGEIAKRGRHIVIHTALLAVFYFIYNVMYIYGWKGFDPLTGSYTISLTVIILPVMMILMKEKVGIKTLISAAMIGIGIFIAFTANEGSISINSLAIVIAAATLRALFYLKLNEAAKEYDSVTLSTLIILFSGIVSYIAWTVLQPTTVFAVPWSKQVIAGLFVHAYFVTVAAQTLNIFAQRRTTAASATLIYALESVFATLFCIVLPAGVASGITLSVARVAAVVFVVMGNLVDLIRMPGENEDAAPAATASASEEVSTPAPAPESEPAPASTPAPASAPKPAPGVKPHPVIDVMKADTGKKVLIALILFVVYLVVSVPFKALDIMPGFTDIRPVTVLHPIYGIFFGIPGCVVLGLGNLVSDIIGGSLRISSAAGVLGNFLGPFLFYIFWAKISRSPFDLRSWPNILKFVGTVIVVAAIETLVVGSAVAYFYPEVEYMRFAVIVFCNTTIFPIVAGIPLTVLIQEEFGFRPVRLPVKA